MRFKIGDIVKQKLGQGIGVIIKKEMHVGMFELHPRYTVNWNDNTTTVITTIITEKLIEKVTMPVVLNEDVLI